MSASSSSRSFLLVSELAIRSFCVAITSCNASSSAFRVFLFDCTVVRVSVWLSSWFCIPDSSFSTLLLAASDSATARRCFSSSLFSLISSVLIFAPLSWVICSCFLTVLSWARSAAISASSLFRVLSVSAVISCCLLFSSAICSRVSASLSSRLFLLVSELAIISFCSTMPCCRASSSAFRVFLFDCTVVRVSVWLSNWSSMPASFVSTLLLAASDSATARRCFSSSSFSLTSSVSIFAPLVWVICSCFSTDLSWARSAANSCSSFFRVLDSCLLIRSVVSCNSATMLIVAASLFSSSFLSAAVRLLISFCLASSFCNAASSACRLS